MKVQLVVVQGKPEGKIIPLALPRFKIGRGEGCQLRPNNDQVSREHAMFEVTSDAVYVQDLGSRNGTDVNSKKLTAHDPYRLKNGDLVKVGPLTFAVAIEGAPVASTASTAGPPRKTSSIDDVGHDEIDAWLVSDASKEPPERPSGVYGGETMSFESMKAKDKPESKSSMTTATPTTPTAKAPVAEPVTEPETDTEERSAEEIEPYQEDDGIEDLSQKVEAELEMPEDMIDESNPFYKKKAEAAPAAAAKGPQKDSSDAANDILRRMMDRRKASKS